MLTVIILCTAAAIVIALTGICVMLAIALVGKELRQQLHQDAVMLDRSLNEIHEVLQQQQRSQLAMGRSLKKSVNTQHEDMLRSNGVNATVLIS